MAEGDIRDELSKLPSWVWIGGIAAGAGLVLATKLRGSSSSSSSSTVDPNMQPSSSLADLSGVPASQGDIASYLGNAGYSSGAPGSSAPAPAPPATGVTYAQTLSTVEPSLYSQDQFNHNAVDTSQGTADLFSTLSEFGTSDVGYQNALAQARADASAGNVPAFHNDIRGLQTYDFGSTTVNPVGAIGQIVTPVPAQPASGGGSGNDYAEWEQNLLAGRGADYGRGLELAGYRPMGVRLNRHAVGLLGAVRQAHTDALVQGAWQDTGTEV